METKTRYWLVESEHAKTEWQVHKDKIKTVNSAMREFCDEVGGTGNIYMLSNGCLSWIEFKGDPGKGWKRAKDYRGYWSPRKNTKEGKALAKRMSSLVNPNTSDGIGNRFLGKSMVFGGYKFYTPGLEILDDIVIIYAKEGNGENCDSWEPIEGLRELKASEYWTLKEQHEALETA